MLSENLETEVWRKSELFKSILIHPAIKSVNSFGLWMAVEFSSAETCKKIIDHCIEQGILTDWFLFAPSSLRISPPLVISDRQIEIAAKIILQSL